MTPKANEVVVVSKDVHCPYCNSDHALLISKNVSKKISLHSPAYGLRFLFSVLYLSIVHIIVYGFKLFEISKKNDNITYGFCPHCGNNYSMPAPSTAKEEVKEPKFYRIEHGKVCMGICKGISEYTGISLLWIRIMTFIYALTVVGAIFYFLVGACIPYKEDAETGNADKRFYRIRKGKDILGLCKGFSEYTGIPVMWVRLFTLISGIGCIFYFFVAPFVPYKEDVEQGIFRKKLKKVKKGKVVLGLCAGIAEYTKMPLWLVRLLTIILIFPWPLYWIVGAIVPTEE